MFLIISSIHRGTIPCLTSNPLGQPLSGDWEISRRPTDNLLLIGAVSSPGGGLGTVVWVISWVKTIHWGPVSRALSVNDSWTSTMDHIARPAAGYSIIGKHPPISHQWVGGGATTENLRFLSLNLWWWIVCMVGAPLENENRDNDIGVISVVSCILTVDLFSSFQIVISLLFSLIMLIICRKMISSVATLSSNTSRKLFTSTLVFLVVQIMLYFVPPPPLGVFTNCSHAVYAL